MKERQIDEREKNLQISNPVETPPLGATDGESNRRRDQHKKSDSQRPARLFQQLEQVRKVGRPQKSDSERATAEERSCAISDTAQPQDECTCAHPRSHHKTAGCWINACELCYCPGFTRADPTLHDQRAEMNRVKQAEERRLELAKKGAPHGTDILGLNDRCKCGHRRSVHIVSDPEGQPTQCAYCICIEFRIASRAWKPI